jgi:hypothetical protein
MKKQSVKKLNFETAKYSKEELVIKLLEEAKKKNIIYRARKQFKGNALYYSHYTNEDLMGILNITIAKVLNSFEVYKMTKLGITPPEGSPTISEDLNLDSFGNLTGYMIEAFKKNFSKDYKKQTADKRTIGNETISIDGMSDEDNKESYVVFNQLKVDTIAKNLEQTEYSRVLRNIFLFLREYDKKMNQVINKKAKKDKTSKFAYLFINIIDPKYKGKFIHMKHKFNWSPYLFEQNKEKMVELIKDNFKDDISFLFDYISKNNTQYGETIRPKKTENYFDQSCEVSSVTEEQYCNKTKNVTVLLNVILYRQENHKKVILDKFIFEKTGTISDISKIKEELKKISEDKLQQMKEKAQNKKLQAIKDIYVN